MRKFKIIVSIIILIVSIVLLFDKLFTPQPIQIILQSGQEITTPDSDYFTLTETIMLIVCAFLIGTTTSYIYYNSDKYSDKYSNKYSDPEAISKGSKAEAKLEADKSDLNKWDTNKYDAILPLLKDDEKRVILALRDSRGEMLQNKLVLKLNTSKVKVTRLLASLESKNLIVKERHGLTNNIKLTD